MMIPFVDAVVQGLRTFFHEDVEFLDRETVTAVIAVAVVLTLVKLLTKAWKLRRGRQAYSCYWVFSDLSFLDPRVRKLIHRGWLYHIPKILIALAALPFLVALASPVLPRNELWKSEEVRQIKFQVDFSGSMSPQQETGPFATVKQIILKILEKSEKSNDQFSVDLFSDNVHEISSFNKDKRTLRFALDTLDVSQYNEGGTRIDLAVDAAVYSFAHEGDKKVKRKIDIILSDADSNNDPTEAILKARKAGVHIYLIGIGALSSTDGAKMVTTVQQAGGVYLPAESPTAVEDALNQISRIEKTAVFSHLNHYNIPIFEPFAVLAFLLFSFVLLVTMSPFFRDFP